MSIAKGLHPALRVEQRRQEVRGSCSTQKSRDCSKLRTKPTKSLFFVVLAHPALLCSFTSQKSLGPVPVLVSVPIPGPVSRASIGPSPKESDPETGSLFPILLSHYPCAGPRTRVGPCLSVCAHTGAGPRKSDPGSRAGSRPGSGPSPGASPQENDPLSMTGPCPQDSDSVSRTRRCPGAGPSPSDPRSRPGACPRKSDAGSRASSHPGTSAPVPGPVPIAVPVPIPVPVQSRSQPPGA